MQHLRPETSFRTLLLLAALIFSALVPASAFAQESEGPVQKVPNTVTVVPVEVAPPITEIYSVRHASVEQLSSLVKIFDLYVRPNAELGVIGLNGKEADVRAALAALERLDVPSEPTPSVQLTLWIVLGAKTPNGGELPSALEPVTRQLAGTLGYEAFELLDTILVRTHHLGGIASDGALEGSRGGAGYGLRAGPIEVIQREGGRIVRLADLAFELRPRPELGQSSYKTTLVTDVEVIEGQKVVVGKATASPDNLGLILILEAKVE